MSPCRFPSMKIRVRSHAPREAHRLEFGVTTAHYEIKVSGRLEASAAEALEGLQIDSSAGSTVLSADMDPAMLHGVIDRVRALGLELQEVRRSPRR